MLTDPCWFPQGIDVEGGRLQLTKLTRDDHANGPFLDHPSLCEGRETRIVPLEGLAPPVPPRLHFLFHSAFCRSTQLARILDLPGIAMAFKEPPVLNALADRWLGEWSVRDAGMLAIVLGLMARPFAPGETVIIKPSNFANPLIDAMLEACPTASALLVHRPLPAFLNAVARRGMRGRLWARSLGLWLGRRPEVDEGLSLRDRLLHTDLLVAGLAWLQHQAQFARLARTLPDRIATLDSERIDEDPFATVEALARRYALPLDGERVRAIVDGPAFHRNAKRPEEAFDRGKRQEARAHAEAVHGEEIAAVTAIVEDIAARLGVPPTLPLSLLDGPGRSEPHAGGAAPHRF